MFMELWIAVGRVQSEWTPSKYGSTSHNATDRYQWRAHVNFDTYSVFDLTVVIVELLVCNTVSF